MKLIIQIPCYNEDETIGTVLKSLPKKIEGINEIEVLLIDDGSRDKSVEIAKSYNVNHIISHINNKGLAKSFMTGINECLRLKADIIVNIDADNQYNADSIKDLVKPILDNTFTTKNNLQHLEQSTKNLVEYFSTLTEKEYKKQVTSNDQNGWSQEQQDEKNKLIKEFYG